MIIRGGRNLYPYELEEAIGSLDGVRRGCVAVFGVPAAGEGTERWWWWRNAANGMARSARCWSARSRPGRSSCWARHRTISCWRRRTPCSRHRVARSGVPRRATPIWPAGWAAPGARRGANCCGWRLPAACKPWRAADAWCQAAMPGASPCCWCCRPPRAPAAAGDGLRWRGVAVLVRVFGRPLAAFVWMSGVTSVLVRAGRFCRQSRQLHRCLPVVGRVAASGPLRRQAGTLDKASARLAAWTPGHAIRRTLRCAPGRGGSATPRSGVNGGPAVVFRRGHIYAKGRLASVPTGRLPARRRKWLACHTGCAVRHPPGFARSDLVATARQGADCRLANPSWPRATGWSAALQLRDATRAVILRDCGEPDLDRGY
jgi:hypothetical protein